MDTTSLTTILSDWSYWDKPIPKAVPRIVHLPKRLSSDLVLVIQGVRRCGKSTFLRQLIKHYQLDPQVCTVANFEDPRLAAHLTHELLQKIVEVAHVRQPKAKKYYFFFDEIQNVELWEKWLHAELERPKNHYFVITGSNATLLSGELGTALTGRHLTVPLFPFNFQEVQQVYPKASFVEYLEKGGFPRVLLDKEGVQLLPEYFNDIVERDIRERVRARSSQSIKQLLQMVFEACGSEVSLRKLAGACGLTADTVSIYLNVSESAYLIGSCPFFAYSERQQLVRNKKYYPIDSALRTSVITPTGLDKGKSLEIAVFWHLLKHFKAVYYWRGKGEVDFIVRGKDGITPHQVSLDGIKPRHEAALEDFYTHHKNANEAVFVTSENAESFFIRPSVRQA
ncbi:MAG: ATP-binding protein [Gammaproteobacteria bacterium]|nr:ATP-binding protein [Gammaproteobacteria bacterium]